MSGMLCDIEMEARLEGAWWQSSVAAADNAVLCTSPALV